MRRRRQEHSLLLKASKILVSWAQASSSNSVTGGERYGHFRSGGEGAAGSAARPRETLMLRAPVARSVSAYHLRSNRESAPMKTAKLADGALHPVSTLTLRLFRLAARLPMSFFETEFRACACACLLDATAGRAIRAELSCRGAAPDHQVRWVDTLIRCIDARCSDGRRG